MILTSCPITIQVLNNRNNIVLAVIWLRGFANGSISSITFKVKKWKWEIYDGEEVTLDTPNVLFVMSPWGNQLYKFALFMQDWYQKVDMLSSIYDLLRIERTKKGEEWKRLGTREFFGWLRKEYLGYFRNKQKVCDYYRDYITYLNGKYPLCSFFMLDSGGYSFRSERLIGRSNLGTLFSQGVDKVSKYVFEKQCSFKPTAIITLDKPIFRLDLGLSEKRDRYDFSLNSAKKYLEYRKEKEEKGTACPLLFAAVQHYGKSLSECNYGMYEKTVKKYISSLIDWEEKLRIYYSGFSVGSLIPITKTDLIRSIGRSVVEVLRERGRKDVLIHGLGIANERADILLKEGFDLFDTNKPIKLARYKYYYHPARKEFVKIEEISELPCTCPICGNHPISHLKENRKGLKEVSTVLIGLHNYYSQYSVNSL